MVRTVCNYGIIQLLHSHCKLALVIYFTKLLQALINLCTQCSRPEHYLRHLNGGLAVTGKALAMPSLSLENDAQAVTADTLSLAQVCSRNTNADVCSPCVSACPPLWML